MADSVYELMLYLINDSDYMDFINQYELSDEQNDKLKPLDVSDEDDSNLEQDYYSTSIKDLVGSNNLDTNNQIIPDRKLDNKNKADKEYNINCFTKELENNLLLFDNTPNNHMDNVNFNPGILISDNKNFLENNILFYQKKPYINNLVVFNEFIMYGIVFWFLNNQKSIYFLDNRIKCNSSSNLIIRTILFIFIIYILKKQINKKCI